MNLKEFTEEERLEDVSSCVSRGNHVSAKVHTLFLSDALSKEIKKGWGILLPLDKARHILELVLSPMGVAEQLGISETGTFIPKKRLTHDLSFPGKISGESVNSQVIKESLELCVHVQAYIF